MENSWLLTRDGTCASDYQVAHGLVVEDLINIVPFGIPDLLQDDGVVETKTCVGSQRSNPRHYSPSTKPA